MHKALVPALAILLTATQAALPQKAEAAIYKCLGDDGGVTYTHAPCPVSDTTSKVLRSSGNSNAGADCRIANNFALDLAEKMREGRTADDTFRTYGGIDALRPTTISIINYVYTHRLNISTVPARIAQLSAARCDSSAYGTPTCDQFPLTYINEAGGCETAAGGAGSVSATAEHLNQQAKQSDYTPSAGNTTGTLSAVRAAPVVPSAQSGMSSEECKLHFESQMANVRESMRARLSAEQQNELRVQYRALRENKNEC